MDDRYTDDDFYNYPFPPFTDNRNKFARASLILGMCSIVLVCTLFLPIPLGALGLLFYFLSKRLHKPVDSSAKACDFPDWFMRRTDFYGFYRVFLRAALKAGKPRCVKRTV